jgi:aspartate/methionine/tyrosine aminotransferase
LAEHQEERPHAYVKIPEARRRVVIADEADEHLIFDRRRHVQIATLPGLPGLPDLPERTVTIGSAGKMFSVTGWKVQDFLFPTVSAGSRKRNTS